jgi:hypothetical protein
MGKQLFATVHSSTFNELTESEVSELTSTTIDETGLDILKRKCRYGITIVSRQKNLIFDSLILHIKLTGQT